MMIMRMLPTALMRGLMAGLTLGLMPGLMVVLLPCPQARADEPPVVLKDGPGKDLVEQNCQMCHSLDYIQMNSVFLDHKGWQGTVDKMVNKMGAPVPPQDVPVIVDYLSKFYGK